MICESSYDSLDQIPEALRDEFEKKGSKYVLKADAIPGVGDLFNAGIAANRDRALKQLKTATEVTIPGLNSKISELETNQPDSLAPGSVVLSPDDAKAWKRFNELGTVKEVEEKVKKFPELEKEVATTALAASLAAFKDLGLNNDVLTDWLSNTPGLTAFLKDGKVLDAKGNQVDGKIPMLKVETPDGNNKIKVEEVALMTYAKEKLPDWKYTALTTPPAAAQGGAQTQQPTFQQPVIGQQPQTGGVFLPNQSSAATGNGGGGSGEKKNYAAQFNEERSKAGANPFVTQPAATNQNQN